MCPLIVFFSIIPRPISTIDMTILTTYNQIMITMNINEAKTHLSSALEKVARGETVVLCKRNKPVAEIRPVREPLREKRPIGLAAREFPGFTVDRTFFEPLPDDIVTAFSGEGE